MKLRWVTPFILMSFFASATEVRGRINFGAFVATERFTNDIGGSDKNDSEVISSELFLKATHITDTKFEFTMDLRDKNDFFDKPDPQRLQLDAKNSFQAQEMNVKWNGDVYGYTFGRFHVMEAGVDGVDGARFDFKKSSSWTESVFTGTNAKTVDQIYYQYNQDTNISGISATYQPKMTDWLRNVYMTQAFVTNEQFGTTDRIYAFQNTVYQWNPRSRLMSLLYLDFIPRVFVQNGNVTWQQGVTDRWSTQVNGYSIDTITYSHRQDVREALPSSPYRELNAKADYNFTPLAKLEFGAADGRREADGLSRQEYYVGYERNRLFSKHFDAFFRLGARDNFTSNDIFSHLYAGYFGQKFEFDFDGEFDVRHYRTDGLDKHPVTVALSYSRFFWRDLYGMISVESDSDETVKVLSGFFRIGYRFGGSDNMPLRDTPPARGQL